MLWEKTFLILIVASALILISACEFEPQEVYSPDRNEDAPPPQLIVNELSFQLDTIYLYKDILLSFDFSSEEVEILGVVVKCSNRETKIFESAKGSVSFSQELMLEGPHQVSLEVFTTSGTGSIADQLKMENYVFKKEWVLWVKKDYYGIQTSVSDGFLKLDWENCPDQDFIEYLLTSEKAWANVDYSTRYSEFIDSGYIGNADSYHLHTNTGSYTYLRWGDADLQNNFPFIKHTKTDSASYFLHWEKPKYYNAIKTIEITEAYLNAPDKIVKIVTDMSDTIYHIQNIHHKETRWYRLKYTGKYPKSPFTDMPATADSYSYNITFNIQ